MKQIKGCDVTTDLTRLRVLVVICIPLATLMEVLTEVVHFFHFWQKNVWMPRKEVMKGCRATLLGPNDQEMRQGLWVTPTKFRPQVT
tara:strand:- start:61 stop:321 length:261 start_codon:yes stop_codon:yes gene_type:complete